MKQLPLPPFLPPTSIGLSFLSAAPEGGLGRGRLLQHLEFSLDTCVFLIPAAIIAKLHHPVVDETDPCR